MPVKPLHGFDVSTFRRFNDVSATCHESDAVPVWQQFTAQHSIALADIVQESAVSKIHGWWLLPADPSPSLKAVGWRLDILTAAVYMFKLLFRAKKLRLNLVEHSGGAARVGYDTSKVHSVAQRAHIYNTTWHRVIAVGSKKRENNLIPRTSAHYSLSKHANVGASQGQSLPSRLKPLRHLPYVGKRERLISSEGFRLFSASLSLLSAQIILSFEMSGNYLYRLIPCPFVGTNFYRLRCRESCPCACTRTPNLLPSRAFWSGWRAIACARQVSYHLPSLPHVRVATGPTCSRWIRQHTKHLRGTCRLLSILYTFTHPS